MGDNLPKISIITPCLNSASWIREAIQSVIDQDYPNFEHIVIDGGSTDGTLEILRLYPHLHVISEPDSGMYDAINKGLQIATGEFIGLLNADDYYEISVFQRVACALRRYPDTGVFYGDITLFECQDGKEHIIKEVFIPESKHLTFQALALGVPINACIMAQRLYTELGGFNVAYRVASDRDFLMHLAMRGPLMHHIGSIVYHYRVHESSLTFAASTPAKRRMWAESERVALAWLRDPALSTEARRYAQSVFTKANLALMSIALHEKRWQSVIRRGWVGVKVATNPMAQRYVKWVKKRLCRVFSLD